MSARLEELLRNLKPPEAPPEVKERILERVIDLTFRRGERVGANWHGGGARGGRGVAG